MVDELLPHGQLTENAAAGVAWPGGRTWHPSYMNRGVAHCHGGWFSKLFFVFDRSSTDLTQKKMVRSVAIASLLIASAASALAAVEARNTIPGAYIVEFEDGHVSLHSHCLLD